ncbi:MAG: hypothetical protein IPG38_15300 [Chitinophagaceae bacterium]|nr:hypothetical protein [Chitinophagaceae bacterium]
MKKITLLSLFAACLAIFSSCDTIKKPANQYLGRYFSLTGNWKLVSTTDNNAQTGTIVTVSPAIASGFVKSVANNSYCYRATDEAWKSLSSKSGGGFTINHLASACNGSMVYKSGEITVLTNSQIRINTKTVTDAALVQEWTRVTN